MTTLEVPRVVIPRAVMAVCPDMIYFRADPTFRMDFKQNVLASGSDPVLARGCEPLRPVRPPLVAVSGKRYGRRR